MINRKVVTGILFVFVSCSMSACILPHSETSTSRYKVYRRPVDADSRVKFHVNQVGYELTGPKKAIVESVGAGTTFELVDAATKRVVYNGTLKPSKDFEEWGGGPYYHVADFTAYQKESVVQLKIKEYLSYEFKVQQHVLFRETFSMVLDYFEKSRANNPNVLRTDANIPLFNSKRRVDARGGWYDASGDISKYLSHLSYANLMNPQQIPLTAWALGWVHDTLDDDLAVPELKKRIATEALWGADYLVRILDEAGYFYINVFDHWSGEMLQRKICAFETKSGTMTQDWQAAFREGGGLAIAALARASTLGMHGEYESPRYLDSAKKAFLHLQQFNTKYADDGVENVIDDYTALLGASELYAVTDEPLYLKAAQKRADGLMQRLHPTGYFIADSGKRPFWHASDAGLPVVALIRYVQIEPDAALQKKAKQVIKKHLQYQFRVTEEVLNPFGYARQHFTVDDKLMSGFFIPHKNESKYWWQGENARLGSLAAAAVLAARLLGNDDLFDKGYQYASDQVNWILGMNPFGYCFLKGAGSLNSPPYATFPNDKHHADLDGGIANGITGSNESGEGIEYWNAPGLEVRNNFRWRWLEQWLPHSTWYMIALVAVSNR